MEQDQTSADPQTQPNPENPGATDSSTAGASAAGQDETTAQSGEQSSSTQSADPAFDALQNELTDTKMRLQELTNISQRALADLQNFKRRSEEEKFGIIAFANAGLMTDLIPSVDNIHRALEHAPTDLALQEWLTGVTASLRELENTLTAKGLKPIESQGQNFNPNLHEALLTVDGEKDMVIKELEKGYYLGEKVLKRAKVSVGNGNTPEQTPPQ
jgi:molecular chaperone GrpE